VNAEEKRHSGEIHPAPGWSDIPRRDVEGVSEGSGAGDRPSEVHGPSPKTLSDNFNKQVMEAILGKSHHRLSENAVSMPPINPDTPPAKRVQADTAPMPEETGPGTDDWLEKANAALLRLRKKREEEAMPPQQTPQSPAQEQAPPVNSFKEPDSVVEDNASVVESEDRPMVEDSLVAGFEEGSGEGMSSEAYMSKNETDVYWGWDKKKKRFVGVDDLNESNGPVKESGGDELPQGDVPSRAKTPLAQCTVLREELKKQAAAAINSKDINPKEIVISRMRCSGSCSFAGASDPPAGVGCS